MAQVFDVFGEVAEEEDVAFADFACDFDLDGRKEDGISEALGGLEIGDWGWGRLGK